MSDMVTSVSAMETILTRRCLNRATSERQLLLRRAELSALDAIERLVGLQAQDPDPPYVGLWARITAFRLDDLTRLLFRREVVRATLFRGTQHLVTAEDYLWLRPLLQPMLDRWQKGSFGRFTAGLDLAELAAAARSILGQDTLSRPELGRALVERWPGRDPVGLAGRRRGCCRWCTRRPTAPGEGEARLRSRSPTSGSTGHWPANPRHGN